MVNWHVPRSLSDGQYFVRGLAETVVPNHERLLVARRAGI
jgi:hypothetical protein